MTRVFSKIKNRMQELRMPCQIDFLNKQLVSPLNWNNPSSKSVLDELYILMIYWQVDAKEKDSFDVEVVFNNELHLKSIFL